MNPNFWHQTYCDATECPGMSPYVLLGIGIALLVSAGLIQKGLIWLDYQTDCIKPEEYEHITSRWFIWKIRLLGFALTLPCLFDLFHQ